MNDAPHTLTVTTADGEERQVAYSPGQTLAQAVYLSGFFPAPALCSGLGRCGACSMRFLSPPPSPLEAELDRLPPEEIDAGHRLGCRHAAAPNMHVALPPQRAPRETPRIAGAAADPALAVDLGTTSLCWRITGGPEGHREVLAEGRELNPQLGAGAEVMSRLAYAADPGRAATLRALVVDRIAAIRDAACPGVETLCVAANPAMTCLLLGRDTAGLARAPYRLDYQGGRWESLDGLGRAYIPPLLAPFIGGDLTAGLAWLRFGLKEPAYPHLLVDLGTNGEIVLATETGELTAASVAMGPALEGVGLTHGDAAGPHTATSFSLSPRGLVPHVPGGGPPSAIAGAGYISLLAGLRRAGALDEAGRFIAAPDSPLGKAVARSLYRERDETRLDLGHGMALRPRDVEEVLKVKAACNAALSGVLSAAGFGPGDMAAVHVAGAMGKHVPPRDLADLGFLPAGMASRARAAGNTSLAGASLLLARPEARTWVETATDHAHTLELAGADGFQERFLRCMNFDWTD